MLWLISFPDSLRQIAIDDDSHELGFIEFSGLGNPQNYSRAEQSRKCQTGLAALTFASEQHRKAKSQAHDDACDDLVQVGENRHSRRDAALTHLVEGNSRTDPEESDSYNIIERARGDERCRDALTHAVAL